MCRAPSNSKLIEAQEKEKNLECDYSVVGIDVESRFFKTEISLFLEAEVRIRKNSSFSLIFHDLESLILIMVPLHLPTNRRLFVPLLLHKCAG